MSIFKSMISMTGSSNYISSQTIATNYNSRNSTNQTSNSSTMFNYETFNPALPGAPIIVDQNGNIICLYKKKF
ncbi:hypothetical protein RB653_001028 [Dictyostelium firmibasis]|uniref:Uncharacterized protein n=1 Tax=Dictyostelium firmibasis TaxID=79012 RepID=A0AAN7YWC3_9MYCE